MGAIRCRVCGAYAVQSWLLQFCLRLQWVFISVLPAVLDHLHKSYLCCDSRPRPKHPQILASTIPLFPIPLEWGMGDTFPAFPARAGDGYMVGAGGPRGAGSGNAWS